MGEHRFTYALLPFRGPFGESALVRSGYELNDPAQVESVALDSTEPAEYSLFRTEGQSVITEAIKASEASTTGSWEKWLVIHTLRKPWRSTKTVM